MCINQIGFLNEPEGLVSQISIHYLSIRVHIMWLLLDGFTSISCVIVYFEYHASSRMHESADGYSSLTGHYLEI